MTGGASLTLLVVVGVLYAAGVTVMLERSLTRILVGFLLVGNATNLLLFAMSGRPGDPPILGDGADPAAFADPVPQALILTAIVINFGITAFLLALIYRSWWLARLGDRGDMVVDEEAEAVAAADAAAMLESEEDDDEAIQQVLEASDETDAETEREVER